ncbi:MAG: HD domain-containing protein [Eubacteriales bacterium]|nr:HD domain-containing protein [Eubacteriales bacterium]
MDTRELLNALHVAERLKDATRHCYTSGGRHESVAEHSWRMALMAYFIKDAFPKADMDKVIHMCLIHDLGEAFTGDIPSFIKTQADEDREENLLYAWVSTLPAPFDQEMLSLYREMSALESLEAKIYKALDGMEAVIQHNESDIQTWSPNEYALNMTYADDKVAFSPYLKELRELMREDTRAKIEKGEKE